ncbi:cell division cycle 5-like protein [Magnolia sinica]|uniref:cell division cycle 5-like protein n=1 Tax=Magnolia sinica TaxID=86752 RepID=UPI0026582EC1|nr:cell division cycle 5-like protein [Magnolia sinica]
MRIMIKGGVWKNTEDEILKAAVMKYGKNQWARISSLLVRKSAKQCKARWYEWLDPSIKKTEWTREEDEKLLHLAKLMPTQWRTIAPIVGRTPSQCLERYEKLLDAACVKDENYEPSDDPRKLRPGEIDPNPESKPARPDPVDMDEDEKEMLSEARARLANTRGKKAKRKAREKQLEEARRLASLQKRRELKAAGIDTRQRKRKRKGIDYNAEIPFEKRPPPGFYDVADEERPVDQPKFPTTIEELEGKRRVDVEAQLRKQDIAKNKIAQRQDAPSSILQVNKLNDPEAVRKRSKLMLPPPQISDHELEEIAKLGYEGDLVLGNEELADGTGATRALLANYAQTPRQGMTPLRTPQRTPGGKADAIMMEAENLARLRESQTPLLGGENPELHPSDFSGVTPKKREIQTPNPMATPLASPGPMALTPRIGMTPSRDGYSYGVTPKGTPLRDELHINEDMDMHDSAKLELRRQAELRRNLHSGLINLPQPKNEYQIVIQPIPEENEEAEDKIEEDMSDRLAREKAEEEARQMALLRKRSKVLQRELPRPPTASLDLIKQSLIRGDEDKSSFVPPTLIEQADEMIRKELLALLEHDNAKYPLDEKTEKDKEKKKGVKRTANGKPALSIPEIEDFEEDALKEADSLIKEEVQFLRVAMGHEEESLDEFIKARDACQEDLMYFPARNAYGLASVANNSDKLVALQNEFENVKKRMDDEAKKALRLEQKIKVLTQGYQMRAGKLWSQIEATYKQMDTAGTELECFRALQKQEQFAATHRINGLLVEINKQKELERNLQQRYGGLIVEQDRIQRLLEEYKLELQKQAEIAAIELQKQKEIAAMELQKQEEIAAMELQKQKEIAAMELQQEEIASVETEQQEEVEVMELQKQKETVTIELQNQEEMATVDLQKLEEVLVENRPLGVSVQATEDTDMPTAQYGEPVASSKEVPVSVPIDHPHDETSTKQADVSLDHAVENVNVGRKDINVDPEPQSVTSMNMSLSDNGAATVNEEKVTLLDGENHKELNASGDQFPVGSGDNLIGAVVENPSIPFQADMVLDGTAILNSMTRVEKMPVDHPAGDSRNDVQVVEEDKACDSGIHVEAAGEEHTAANSNSYVESKLLVEDHSSVSEGQNPDALPIKQVGHPLTAAAGDGGNLAAVDIEEKATDEVDQTQTAAGNIEKVMTDEVDQIQMATHSTSDVGGDMKCKNIDPATGIDAVPNEKATESDGKLVETNASSEQASIELDSER